MSKVEFFTAEDFDENYTAEDFDEDYPNLFTRVQAAEIANAKLQREGVKVYGDTHAPADEVGWTMRQIPSDTQTALLIGVRPIAKDTAEDLVREIAALEMFVTKREELGERIGNIVMRARALLGSK